MKPSRFIPRKGLKQYIPDQGWVTPESTSENPNGLLANGDTTLEEGPTLDPEANLLAQSDPAPAREGSLGEGLRDPLLGELLEQLHTPPTDELTQHWSRIAAEVSELNHGMREQKRLRDELTEVESRLLILRKPACAARFPLWRKIAWPLACNTLQNRPSIWAETNMLERLNQIYPVRYTVFFIALGGLSLSALMALAGAGQVMWLLLFGALTALGAYDLQQQHHAILRNYPIIGHLRFMLVYIRPEIRQ